MGDGSVDDFRALGVPDPEGWARSQRSEGIDQIARATVLRQFAAIANGAPDHWDDQRQESATPEVQAAAARVAGSSAEREDIALVLKATVWNTLHDVLAYLDGATEAEINPGGVDVGLFRLGDDFTPAGAVDGLHESWRGIASAILGDEVVRP